MCTHEHTHAHFVLAVFVRLVTWASITAGSKDNLSLLLQQRTDRIFSFRPNQQNNEPKLFVFSLCSVYLNFFISGIQEYIFFVCSIHFQVAPRCWLLFSSVKEFKCIASANKVGRRLCFHPSLLVCWLAKPPRFGRNLMNGFLAKGLTRLGLIDLEFLPLEDF